MSNKTDPGLAEIRRVRHEISAEIGHDPDRLLEYYRKVEAEYADRLVHAEEVRPRAARPRIGDEAESHP